MQTIRDRREVRERERANHAAIAVAAFDNDFSMRQCGGLEIAVIGRGQDVLAQRAGLGPASPLVGNAVIERFVALGTSRPPDRADNEAAE